MIEIEVNFNDDNVKIDNITLQCKYPSQILAVLIELMNRLDPTQAVVISKVDEDTRTVVAEW